MPAKTSNIPKVPLDANSPPSPCSGFGVFRPNGSLFRVILSKKLSDGQEDNILASAWKEIQPDADYRSGTPRPEAENKAKAAGWKVMAVSILPNIP